jgi:hypothetical protein
MAWGMGKSGEPVGWRGVIEAVLRSKWEGGGEEWDIPVCFVHYKQRLARLTLHRSGQTFPMRLFPNMPRRDCLGLAAAARLYMLGSALCIHTSYRASTAILSTMPDGHSVSSIKERLSAS